MRVTGALALSIGVVAMGLAAAPSEAAGAAGAARTATIGPAGGRVTSRDGTIILEVPPRALARPTKITMEPGSTAGLPAKLAAKIRETGAQSIRFLPEGLRFATPATLRV